MDCVLGDLDSTSALPLSSCVVLASPCSSLGLSFLIYKVSTLNGTSYSPRWLDSFPLRGRGGDGLLLAGGILPLPLLNLCLVSTIFGTDSKNLGLLLKGSHGISTTISRWVGCDEEGKSLPPRYQRISKVLSGPAIR